MPHHTHTHMHNDENSETDKWTKIYEFSTIADDDADESTNSDQKKENTIGNGLDTIPFCFIFVKIYIHFGLEYNSAANGSS